MEISSGIGNGKSARVDPNHQLHTFSLTENEQNAALENGGLYNLNTGLVALTGTGDSAALYFKNTEAEVDGEAAIIITAIIIGLFDRSGTITDDAMMTIIRNPTTGTIIDDATNIDMRSNSNFGSSNALESLCYKATATGKTFTDGTDHAIVNLSDGRTSIPELNIDLPKGASLGVNIDLNTSGGANVYAAIVCYRKDGKNE